MYTYTAIIGNRQQERRESKDPIELTSDVGAQIVKDEQSLLPLTNISLPDLRVTKMLIRDQFSEQTRMMRAQSNQRRSQ